MRKILNFLLTVGFILVFAACSKDNPVILDIKLDRTSVEMNEGQSVTVTIESGNGGYTAESSSESVATATVSGNTITIQGIKEGAATVRIKDREDKLASVSVTVTNESDIPSDFRFLWNGETIGLDEANNWGFATYDNRIVITNMLEKKQFILSWTGGLTEGDKSDGTLRVISGKNETTALDKLTVVQAQSSIYYLVFKGDSQSGDIYFRK